MPAQLVLLLGSVLTSLDPIPKDEDVKAGWIGFGLFLALLVVIGLLGWSLTRHLRHVESNRRSGVFGDEPESDDEPSGASAAASPTDGSSRPA
jgi:hypothetical protein